MLIPCTSWSLLWLAYTEQILNSAALPGALAALSKSDYRHCLPSGNTLQYFIRYIDAQAVPALPSFARKRWLTAQTPTYHSVNSALPASLSLRIIWYPSSCCLKPQDSGRGDPLVIALALKAESDSGPE